MKKTLSCLFTLLSFASTYAESGYYAEVQGGVNLIDSKFLHKQHCHLDTGFNIGLLGGYAWDWNGRAEVEVAYRGNEYRLRGTTASSLGISYYGNINIWSAMVNGYYAFTLPICMDVKPYLGLGIGADHVHQNIHILGNTYKGNHTEFSWQLMAGIGYSIADDWMLSLEYKFHEAPLQDVHDLQNHSITIGLKKFLF